MSFLLIEALTKFYQRIKAEELNTPLKPVSSITSRFDDHFLCFCRTEVQLDDDNLRSHIRECGQYQKESPFYKDFFSLPMKSLSNFHLMAMKAELLNIINMVEEELRRRGLKRNPKSAIVIQHSTCSNCRLMVDPSSEKVLVFQNCNHTVCKACLVSQGRREFLTNKGLLSCQKCKLPIVESDLEVANKLVFDKLKLDLITLQYNLVKCKRCKEQLIVSKGQDFKHQNIIFCVKCRVDQCRICGTIPYHTGEECPQQYPILGTDVYCQKVNACGHKCLGFNGESSCLPCLICNKIVDLDDLCSICQIEPFKDAPCIQSKCGHVFHYQCLLKSLKMKQIGSEILFSKCLCPLCKSWMEFQNASEPQEIIKENQKLKNLLDKKIELLQLPQSDPNLYQFYTCFKCQSPYFGGMRGCQQQDSIEEQCICPDCLTQQRCNTHGTQYIVYKCRFCCRRAHYFCWGTTHFCEECHTKQMGGYYLIHKTRDELPKCKPSLCQFMGKHVSNGEEQAMGCSICGQFK